MNTSGERNNVVMHLTAGAGSSDVKHFLVELNCLSHL